MKIFLIQVVIALNTLIFDDLKIYYFSTLTMVR